MVQIYILMYLFIHFLVFLYPILFLLSLIQQLLVYMSFDKRLAQLRKSHKFSQEELAKAIGVHTNILGRYERGEVKPSIDIAIKLAEVFKVSLDFLVGITDAEPDKEVMAKVQAIGKLPENDRQHILFTLDAMLRDAKVRTAYTSV